MEQLFKVNLTISQNFTCFLAKEIPSFHETNLFPLAAKILFWSVKSDLLQATGLVS